MAIGTLAVGKMGFNMGQANFLISTVTGMKVTFHRINRMAWALITTQMDARTLVSGRMAISTAKAKKTTLMEIHTQAILLRITSRAKVLYLRKMVQYSLVIGRKESNMAMEFTSIQMDRSFTGTTRPAITKSTDNSMCEEKICAILKLNNI